VDGRGEKSERVREKENTAKFPRESFFAVDRARHTSRFHSLIKYPPPATLPISIDDVPWCV